MKSKEIYAAVGVLILLLTFVWWGSTREMTENSGTEVTTQNNRPNSSTTKSPTSVNPTVVQEKPVPTTPTSKNLAGTTFRLTTYRGAPLPLDSRFILTFTETHFTLKLCNTLSSNYYMDGNVIKAGNVVSTLMYCSSPENIMQIESDASLMLNSGATTVYRSGSTLILSHPQGIVMSFEGF